MSLDILRDQITYYRARAGEYDEWFYRLGRFDYGQELNQQWFDEVAEVMQALRQLGPVESTLELACGTGNWTRELAQMSREVTALDAAPEMIAVNQAKVGASNVQYRRQDLFAWQPDRTNDLVFFGFWLSHVPPERLTSFLSTVRDALRPGGRLFLVDSRFAETSGAQNQHRPEVESTTHTRTLNDGREFTIVKVFYDPQTICDELEKLGCDAEAHTTSNYFYFVTATRQ